MENVTYISVELADTGRPQERPPKTNWKIDLIRKAMQALQYASPKKVAQVVWHYFTMPGKVYFSESQNKILERARTGSFSYEGDSIVYYAWGNADRKVLLCHGWRSKAADFRRIIEDYLTAGFEVHALDMRAHGRSEGKHTALPEYRDIIKRYIHQTGKFDIVLGYSLGGMAAGVVVDELEPHLRPDKLFLLAAPPFIRFFFKGVINDLALSHAVYVQMANMVGEVYEQDIDYFDLRKKAASLSALETHLIYCEDDTMVPFAKGMELFEKLDGAHFVQAQGFGHYKIISHQAICEYLIRHSISEVKESSLA